MQYIDGVLIDSDFPIPQMKRASGRLRLDFWLQSRIHRYDPKAQVLDANRKPIPAAKHAVISLRDCRPGGSVL